MDGCIQMIVCERDYTYINIYNKYKYTAQSSIHIHNGC